MKAQPLLSLRYFAGLLLGLSLFATACVGARGKVESVSMLYGTDSKVWKTAHETDAFGEKVKQTDGMKQEELRMFADGTYRMTSATATVVGKYTFDQANKSITLIPDGSDVSSTFTVETLTNDRLTLKSVTGAALVLEAR